MNKPTAEQVAEVLKDLTEGDPEFLKELIQAYTENLEEFRSEASLAIRNKDLDRLKAHLHKISPTLITLHYRRSYEELSSIATKMNEDSMENGIRQIESVTQELISHLQEVKQLI